jgi:hypothetical protein
MIVFTDYKPLVSFLEQFSEPRSQERNYGPNGLERSRALQREVVDSETV